MGAVYGADQCRKELGTAMQQGDAVIGGKVYRAHAILIIQSVREGQFISFAPF